MATTAKVRTELTETVATDLKLNHEILCKLVIQYIQLCECLV